MIPAACEYERPDSVEGVIDALVRHGDDAKILAGGHSLIPLMKLRFATPSVLVDVERVPGLDYIRADGDEIAIGALARHRTVQVDPLLRKECPVLPFTARQVGDPQVRHRGTIGGSVAHGDAASDLPTVLLALDATFVLQGPRGRRVVPAAEFFVGFLETAIAADEVLVEIRVPRLGDTPYDYIKFNRRAQDWAIVGVAAIGGASPRIALTHMGPTPVRATAVEEALASGAGLSEAAQLADVGTEPGEDLNADADYRRHLARVLVRRALTTVTRS